MVSPQTRRVLLISVRLAVTLGAGWLVVRKIDWAILIGSLVNADRQVLALAGVVLLIQFAIIVWRWQLVIELLGGGTVAVGLLAIAAGRSMLIGQPLPSTVGGDVVRTLLVSHQTGLALAARSVFCDRITGLVAMVALVVVTLPLFAGLIEAGPAFFALAAVSLGGLVAFLLLLAQPRLLVTLPQFGKHTAMLVADLRKTFVAGRGRVIWILAFTIHLFGVLLIYELARSLATPISLMQCLLIVPPTLLISSIPISLGGWGVREGALAAGFALVGVNSEAGVATSILFGLTGPLIGALAELATPLVRTQDLT
jgi:glycosyltransferase 2 family protein